VDAESPTTFRVVRRESVLRPLLAERAHEFGGLGLIVLGLLLVLSVYVHVTGPVGRGLDLGLRWTLGLGRYAFPLLCLGLGVALLKRISVAHRVRLSVGSLVVAVALLGLMHVFLAGDVSVSLDALESAGGWFGWLVGQPLVSSISPVGALITLSAVALLGLMLASGRSLPELARMFTGSVGRIDDAMRTYREGGREGGRDDNDGDDPDDGDEEGSDGPSFYDHAQYDAEDGDDDEEVDDEEADASEEKPRPRRRRQRAADTPPAAPARSTPVRGEQQQMPLGPAAQPSSWSLPPMDMLVLSSNKRANESSVEERGDSLVTALASHGVDTELVGYTRGPTVTRYELSLGDGVKVARVTSLSKDIAYTMAATDVRILAPIPGRSAIGIEVPNESRDLVSLGDLLTSPEAKSAQHPLDVAVGTSLLMRTTPEQVRLILIDPKQVEMGQYALLPHLLTQPVTNPKKAANALGWAVKEMERRYDVLVEAGFRDIAGYNAAYDRGELNDESESDAETSTKRFERMPYVLVVVDELNDLMMVAARDVEECITRIAQKARAVGIHLIVATQRPSVNVITGVIKANIPARMAFAVSSLTDSRVILDQPGAEKLVGKGDMLLLPGNTNVAQRVQSAWVGEGEVRKVAAHWKRQAPEPQYVSGVEGGGEAAEVAGLPGGSTGDEDDDELLRHAIDLVVRSQIGSTSMLQRKLKVGFARAGRLMDLLEQRGVVGPSEGSKPREVLMTVEELDHMQRGN